MRNGTKVFRIDGDILAKIVHHILVTKWLLKRENHTEQCSPENDLLSLLHKFWSNLRPLAHKQPGNLLTFSQWDINFSTLPVFYTNSRNQINIWWKICDKEWDERSPCGNLCWFPECQILPAIIEAKTDSKIRRYDEIKNKKGWCTKLRAKSEKLLDKYSLEIFFWSNALFTLAGDPLIGSRVSKWYH